MIFNFDKNFKQNLLNEYKKEAINYRQKKDIEKQNRIKEEREYLLQREKKEKEEEELLFQRKLEKKNEQKSEYQNMLEKTKNNIPGYRSYSNRNKKEIVLNNWGGQEKSHKIHIKNNLINNNFSPQTEEDNIPWKILKYRNQDHLSSFLNDNRNENELNNFMKEEKEIKQKFYKELLYSQFQEANQKNLDLYGTNDPLIIQRRKRKGFLDSNPYNQKYNYVSGRSNLSHNPITNPENNLEYNKYLKFSGSNQNIFNQRNTQTINYALENDNMQNLGYQYNINDKNSIGRNMSNSNPKNYLINNNNYGIRTTDEIKSNNYDTNYVNRSNNINQSEGKLLQNNLKNQNNGYQINQNLGYGNNNYYKPTPSGERIRNAAASNFL